jgi:hypothetical protein
MNDVEREQLACGYLRNLERWQELEELVRTDPESAWDVLLRIINRSPYRELFLLGAGPLSELVASGPDRFHERVIAELRSNPAFLEAFRFVRLREAPVATRRELRTAMLVAGVPESELYDRP